MTPSLHTIGGPHFFAISTENDLAAQARSYGEILVTCAACHAGDRTKAK